MVLETDRLLLDEFSHEDAPFILELLNTPGFLTFIGDKKVRTIEAAKDYITDSLLKSYQNNGFGLWRVVMKAEQKTIGMCGLVNRDILEDVDIGFAFLPEYTRKGLGYEAAQATLEFARDSLHLERVVAITHPDNQASIGLLQKLGYDEGKPIAAEDKGETLLFFTQVN